MTHSSHPANPQTLLWQHCPRFLAGVLTALIVMTAGCGGTTTNGDMILLSSNEFGNWRVVVLDVDSSMTYRITGDPSGAGPPSTYQVIDLSDGPVVEIVDPTWSDVDPTWSPDGEQIAVSSNRFGDFELLVLDASISPHHIFHRVVQAHNISPAIVVVLPVFLFLELDLNFLDRSRILRF